jgi:hypothetical protein
MTGSHSAVVVSAMTPLLAVFVDQGVNVGLVVGAEQQQGAGGFVGAEGPGHEQEALVGQAAQVVAVFGAQGVAGGDVLGVPVGDGEDRHGRSFSRRLAWGRRAPTAGGCPRPEWVGQGESSSRTLPLVSIPNRAVIRPPISAMMAKARKT